MVKPRCRGHEETLGDAEWIGKSDESPRSLYVHDLRANSLQDCEDSRVTISQEREVGYGIQSQILQI